MRKALIGIIALGLMVGCTNYTKKTNITVFSGEDTTIDATGLTNTNSSDQKADGDFSGVADAAKKWLEGNAAAVMDMLKKGEDIVIPTVPKEDTFVPADPSQGNVEVIE